MKLGAGAVGLAVVLFLPLGGRELGGVFGQHVGQAGQYVCEVFFGGDAEATTVLYDGVEDGAFLPGFLNGVVEWGRSLDLSIFIFC